MFYVLLTRNELLRRPLSTLPKGKGISGVGVVQGYPAKGTVRSLFMSDEGGI